MKNRVPCDICKKLFTLKASEDIIESRTMDENDREIAPREWIIVCLKCQTDYAVVAEEDTWEE